MQSFNRNNLNEIRKDLEAALAQVATKHGIQLSVGTIRFGEESFSAKISGDVLKQRSTISNSSGDSLLDSMMRLDRIASTTNAKGDRLTKFNPSSPKYAYSYTSARGTSWKITAEQARQRFGKAA